MSGTTATIRPQPTPATGIRLTPAHGDHARVCSELEAALLARRNADGGWAYRSGKRSRIEPTCWALLALARVRHQPPDITALRAWRRDNGWLVDVERAPVNYAFNAIAALTFLHAGAVDLADPIVARLTTVKGITYPESDVMRQDNSLQAWSWVEGTFSWVEPTAWSLLLLKQRYRDGLPHDVAERIRVAERMLVDRACVGGGWNYGNSNVFGRDLWPYVPTTVLALLALQDRRDLTVVADALRELRDDVRAECSAGAVALTIQCLRAFGLPADDLARGLAAMAVDLCARDVDQDQLAMAMTLCALSDPSASPIFTLETRA